MRTYDEPDQDSQDVIRSMLLGRTVIKVSDATIRLDDGTELTIHGNDGGCSCGAGDYELTELNECPANAIMAVEFDHHHAPCTESWCAPDHKYCETDQSYRVFVLAEDRRIKLWQVDGNDGNGYYGTGYWVEVKR